MSVSHTEKIGSDGSVGGTRMVSFCGVYTCFIPVIYDGNMWLLSIRGDEILIEESTSFCNGKFSPGYEMDDVTIRESYAVLARNGKWCSTYAYRSSWAVLAFALHVWLIAGFSHS